jgi:Tol biopolymer transport system component
VLLVCHSREALAELTFSKPVKVLNVGHPAPDWSPDISSDGLSLFLTSVRPGGLGAGDIWMATRATTDADWTAAENLGESVNSEYTETTSFLSPDGLSLFLSNWLQDGPWAERPGGFGGGDIWVATRTTLDADWTVPQNLGATVNTSDHEGNPGLSADGLTMLFDSTRPGGEGGVDVWMTTRETDEGEWTSPVSLGAPVNGPNTDSVARLSSSSLAIVFHSDRPGGFGASDLWMAMRAAPSDPWQDPVNLGATINTEAWEGDVDVSADFPALGSTLYFTRGVGPDWSIYEAKVVPEPSTLAIVAAACVVGLLYRRRRWLAASNCHGRKPATVRAHHYAHTE